MTKLPYFYLITFITIALNLGQPLKAQDLFAVQQEADIPTAALINNVEHRKTHSLNGTWNALIDPTVFSFISCISGPSITKRRFM